MRYRSRRSWLRRSGGVWRFVRRNVTLVIGLTILAIMLLVAVLASFIALPAMR